MTKRELSPEALALLYLREQRRWSQAELARARGHAGYRLISRYETGEKALSRSELDELASLLGFSREAVDALLFTYSLILPSSPEPPSPVALRPQELARIDRTVIAGGWTHAADLRVQLIAEKKQKKATAARREARELWARLKTLTAPARRALVEESPDFWSWALAEHLCLESERAAAHEAREALALADLALVVAGLCGQDGEAWRSRLLGYGWAHKGNALRVASELFQADAAFQRGWTLWKEGAASEAGLLPEWRILSLEASLRRDQRRFSESLELLDRAKRVAAEDVAARGVILLNKEFVCEQMGDLSGALSCLSEAAPLVEASGDSRLAFTLRFKMANNLYHLERHTEAADWLRQARDSAERLGNELDLLRVLWLSARIAAGQGLREEAIAGLEQVRRQFSVRGIPYDAALASLDLAVVYLKAGRTGAVKALAREMAPVFQALGIAREALASAALFVEAAQQETASVELAYRVIQDLREARPMAPRPENGSRSRRP